MSCLCIVYHALEIKSEQWRDFNYENWRDNVLSVSRLNNAMNYSKYFVCILMIEHKHPDKNFNKKNLLYTNPRHLSSHHGFILVTELDLLLPSVCVYTGFSFPHLCLCRYRTYMRPRYKVAYKLVTDMEWKCCHGYSGADCNDGPVGATGSHVSVNRPQHRPGYGGGSGGHAGGVGGGSYGAGENGGQNGK